MTPLARTAGHVLALTALGIAFAVAAQVPVHEPHPRGGGFLPWIFAALVAAAIVGVFLFVLWVVQRPSSRPPGPAHR